MKQSKTLKIEHVGLRHFVVRREWWDDETTHIITTTDYGPIMVYAAIILVNVSYILASIFAR